MSRTHTLEVPLDVLDETRTATVTTDAADGTALTEFEEQVDPDSTLTVPIAANGGFVVRL